MTIKETIELIESAVTDEITSLQTMPESEQEWATIRVSQLEEALENVKQALINTPTSETDEQ